MTGFGKAEGQHNGKRYSIELRSVNNRFNEISLKYPKFLSSKDYELKEIIRKKITRGKVSASITLQSSPDGQANLTLNKDAIKYYHDVLKSLRKMIGSKEKIRLEHVLKFTDLLTPEDMSDIDTDEFKFLTALMNEAIDDLLNMKVKEGDFLKDDILKRINFIDKESDIIAELSREKIPQEKEKIMKKVEALLQDQKVLDEKRFELELVLLSEKLDITEECIRLKSHLKYFAEFAGSDELAGRRLNFLMQEINREVNTIASKSMDSDISQRASYLKEEVEKIREQLQNVE